MTTFEKSREWYILLKLAIQSNGTKYRKEYETTKQLKIKINYNINNLSTNDTQPNSVSNILKKLWYQWYITDMNCSSPIQKNIRKKLISSIYDVS